MAIAKNKETSSAGAGATGSGAVFVSNYADRTLEGVLVSIQELEDFKAENIEEFWQFAFGGFLMSGSFWLGIERWFTLENIEHDPLFWICAVAFFSGAVISFFGFRQLRRRKNKIDRIIEAAKKQIKDRAEGHPTTSNPANVNPAPELRASIAGGKQR